MFFPILSFAASLVDGRILAAPKLNRPPYTFKFVPDNILIKAEVKNKIFANLEPQVAEVIAQGQATSTTEFEIAASNKNSGWSWNCVYGDGNTKSCGSGSEKVLDLDGKAGPNTVFVALAFVTFATC